MSRSATGSQSILHRSMPMNTAQSSLLLLYFSQTRGRFYEMKMESPSV
jgi:hypothetical protein